MTGPWASSATIVRGNGEVRLMTDPSSEKISPGNPTQAIWSPSAITCTSAWSGLPCAGRGIERFEREDGVEELDRGARSRAVSRRLGRARDRRVRDAPGRATPCGCATCRFAPRDGLQPRVRLQHLAGEDRADARRFARGPAAGSLLLTSMWLMLPAAPMVKRVSMPAPLTLARIGGERVGVVGRRFEAADGVLVQGEVDVGGERLALARIRRGRRAVPDRSGRPARTIFGLSLPGFQPTVPSFMKKRRLKLTVVLAAFAEGGARGRQLRLSEADAFGDFAGQFGAVALGGFEIAAVRACARSAVGDQRAGVAVGGADHDVGGGDAGGAVRSLARFLDDGRRDADEVAGYERDALLARRDHDRLGMQIVVDAGGEAGRVVACHGRARRAG